MKKTYSAPKAEVVKIHTAGFLATSTPKVNLGSDPYDESEDELL